MARFFILTFLLKLDKIVFSQPLIGELKLKFEMVTKPFRYPFIKTQPKKLWTENQAENIAV